MNSRRRLSGTGFGRLLNPGLSAAPKVGTAGPSVDFEPSRGVIAVFGSARQHPPLAYGSDHSDIPAQTKTAPAAVATNFIGSGMTASSAHVKFDFADITSTLVDYILSHHPSRFDRETLPRDESLLELEVLDSAGVIEFIVFAETTWDIEISDEDITKERMGSLNKMAALVREYAARKK
jgi:acyl carrier protein